MSDFVEAADLAIETIERVYGSKPRCEIEVVWPTRTRNLEATESLALRVQERDLASITSVSIEVGEELGTFVSLRATRKSPAVSLEVKGDDDTIVDGLFSQLSEVVSRRHRRISRELVVVAMVVLGISYFMLALRIVPNEFDFPRGRRGNVD